MTKPTLQIEKTSSKDIFALKKTVEEIFSSSAIFKLKFSFMIIIKLRGGLGNQLFQYALGRKLAKNANTELRLDLTLLHDRTNVTPRAFTLNIFNINATIATKKDEQKILGPRLFRPIKRRLWKMGIDLFHWNYFRETSFEFHPEILEHKGSMVLEGYWQSEDYFKDIRNTLLKELTVKDSLISPEIKMTCQYIKDNESVAVHVRRGDYVANPIVNQLFGICSLEYYEKAIDLMKSQLQNPKFFVFSDDTDWCKMHLKFSPYDQVQFMNGNKDFEDFLFMSSCHHQIIANSSFSWWAAWLNPYQHKKIIAPKNWFVSAELNTSHVVPAEWIRL